MVQFGEYNILLIRSSRVRDRVKITFQIKRIDGKPITENEIKGFFSSYFKDMGKWEQTMYLGQELIKKGLDLFKGFDLIRYIEYTPQKILKYENNYSILNMSEASFSDVKTVIIEVQDVEKADKDVFFHHMENVDKWRNFKKSLRFFTNLISDFEDRQRS